MKSLLHAIRCRPTHNRDFVVATAWPWIVDSEAGYRSDARLLKDASKVWRWVAAVDAGYDCCNRRGVERAAAAQAAVEHLRKRMDVDPGRTRFTGLCRDAGISALGRDLLMLLALAEVGLWPGRAIEDLVDLVAAAQPAGFDAVDIARCAGPEGELHRAGLVELPHNDFGESRRIRVATAAVAALLAEGSGRSRLPQSEEEVVRRCPALYAAAFRYAESAAPEQGAGKRGTSQLPPAVAGLAEPLLRAVRRNKSWVLCSRLQGATVPEQCAVLLAVGYAAGGAELIKRDRVMAGPDESPTLTGRLLVHATLPADPARKDVQRLLGPDSRLRRDGLLRPAGTAVALDGGRDLAWESVDFELTATLRRDLGLPLCASSGPARLVTPRLTRDHLVLAEETAKALDEAVVQARERSTLLDGFGLRAIAPYGNAVTLLFHGEPGTGKTASAEALAHALAAPLMVLDFAAVQSRWVGETEKNLSQAFREAEDLGAVLLLDEVDSLLASRAYAARSWEISQVNMLLALLEHHAGVVVMATNRADTLDEAVTRRLSARVPFPRPDAALSARLWQRLIPADYPLAGKPDFEALGRLCLTGAEIKNVLFAAARQALASPRRRKVQSAELVSAARAQFGADQGCIGFLGNQSRLARG